MIKRFVVTGFATLAMSAGASAQPATTGWTMSYSDSEGLQKLMFVGAGEMHANVYMRCRPGEGWIFLIHDVQPKASSQVEIKAGSETLLSTARREYDPVDEDFYLDVPIPANHRVGDQLGAGKALILDGIRYPVATATEQRTIANFFSICDGD